MRATPPGPFGDLEGCGVAPASRLDRWATGQRRTLDFRVSSCSLEPLLYIRIEPST
jgi:hypothetical protein